MSVSGCLDRPCTPLWELLGLQPHNPALDWQEQLKWSAVMTSFMDSVVSCVGWGSGLFIVLQCFLFVCLFCRCPKTIYWPFLAPASWNTTLNKTLKKPVAHSVPEPAEDSLFWADVRLQCGALTSILLLWMVCLFLPYDGICLCLSGTFSTNCYCEQPNERCLRWENLDYC